MSKLTELEFAINQTTGLAAHAEGDLLVVESADHDFSLTVTANDEAIMVVSHLFSTSEVTEVAALNELFLKLSPVVPLSAIGKIENDYILYGSMAPNTIVENAIYEVQQHFDNHDDVLASASELLA